MPAVLMMAWQSSPSHGLAKQPVVILRIRIVILGLDPRITLSPYPLNSSHFSVVRAATDARGGTEHDRRKPEESSVAGRMVPESRG